jgi:hypothetical protein
MNSGNLQGNISKGREKFEDREIIEDRILKKDKTKQLPKKNTNNN